jgi:hypothetical protein
VELKVSQMDRKSQGDSPLDSLQKDSLFFSLSPLKGAYQASQGFFFYSTVKDPSKVLGHTINIRGHTSKEECLLSIQYYWVKGIVRLSRGSYNLDVKTT